LNISPFDYRRVSRIIIPDKTSIEFRLGFDQQLSCWLIDDIVLIPSHTALPPIPEPATWTLLIAGFGLVGAAARRRRSASRQALQPTIRT